MTDPEIALRTAHRRDAREVGAVLGRGVGGRLLRSRLARCDADVIPAYLENSNKSNIPLYEKFGFTVTGEIQLPEGPVCWSMWREPRQSAL